MSTSPIGAAPGTASLSSLRLQEARDRLYWVLDHVVDGIITIDDEGIIESANPAAESIFGYAVNELLGQNVKVLLADRPRNPGEGSIETFLTAGGRREVTGRRKNGSIFPLDLAVSEFHLEGKRFFTGIVRDITERKREEDRTRFLADSTALLSSVVDSASLVERVAQIPVPLFADWCIVDLCGSDGLINRAAVAHRDAQKEKALRRLKRRTPAGGSRSSPLAHEVIEHKRGRLVAHVDDPFLICEPAGANERELVLRLNPQSLLCAPLIVQNHAVGAITFVLSERSRRYDGLDLCLADDFAHRAAIAIENARLYDEAREADRRKDEFLAMLAHELRNPLAPIGNAVEVLRVSPSDSEVASKAINAIDRQVNHMVRLVDDLLDISRLMRGKIQLRFERIQIQHVVERAIETARPIIESHRHTLVVNVPKDPVWLRADPVRLDQIISNLLNNAAKYTDKGGCIRVSAKVQHDELMVRVRDNGIGIDPKILPKLFDPFRQAESTLERSQGGLGIGLTLVRSLVEMHGGQVEAHSDGPGTGAEFIVRLPVLEGQATPIPPSRAVDLPVNPALRILVVDDNVDAAEMLSALLTLDGHTVATVHDGRSALKEAAQRALDVILLDIGLPELNGYEVAKRLRARENLRRTKIIAMTGFGQERDRNRALSAGCDEHLPKPVAPATLRACLRKLASHAPPSS